MSCLPSSSSSSTSSQSFGTLFVVRITRVGGSARRTGGFSVRNKSVANCVRRQTYPVTIESGGQLSSTNSVPSGKYGRNFNVYEVVLAFPGNPLPDNARVSVNNCIPTSASKCHKPRFSRVQRNGSNVRIIPDRKAEAIFTASNCHVNLRLMVA